MFFKSCPKIEYVLSTKFMGIRYTQAPLRHTVIKIGLLWLLGVVQQQIRSSKMTRQLLKLNPAKAHLRCVIANQVKPLLSLEDLQNPYWMHNHRHSNSMLPNADKDVIGSPWQAESLYYSGCLVYQITWQWACGHGDSFGKLIHRPLIINMPMLWIPPYKGDIA